MAHTPVMSRNACKKMSKPLSYYKRGKYVCSLKSVETLMACCFLINSNSCFKQISIYFMTWKLCKSRRLFCGYKLWND